MANYAFLASGQNLEGTNYLVSPGGFFFAAMQPDGNLVVYHGQDPANMTTPLWTSNSQPGHLSSFFLAMQSDGNLCIYEGAPGAIRGTGLALWASGTSSTAPVYLVVQDDGNLVIFPGSSPSQSPGKAVWATNKCDPVTSVQISSLEYDLANATMGSPQEAAPPDTQIVPNHSDAPQQPVISGSLSYTKTSGWSDSLAIGLSVKSNLSVEVPFIAKETIEISLSVTNTYQWNGSTSTTESVQWSVPCNVPAHTEITVEAHIYTTDITVPFTETGTVTFQSGTSVTGTFDGVYKGTGGYTLETSYGKAKTLPPEAPALIVDSGPLTKQTSSVADQLT
jgi:hypothetical protein